MGNLFKTICKKVFTGKGFFIKFSTGRPFDPGTQERTDAIQDLVKQKRKEDKEAKHGYNDDVA